MEIKEENYFCFNISAWTNTFRVVPVGKIEELIERVEKGENLFSVVPLFRTRIGSSHFQNGYFAIERFVEIGEEKFISEKGYVREGRLLVPHDLVFGRSVLEREAKSKELPSYQRKRIEISLDSSPGVSTFYIKEHQGVYVPLNEKDVFVLRKNQLGRTC
jgi:hypothetical protein